LPERKTPLLAVFWLDFDYWAPVVGFEPTTFSLHLSPCFHEAWTISSSPLGRSGI